MSTIIGIAGSVRQGSYNAALLRAAMAAAPDGLRVEAASIAGIPLYDGDLEKEHGVPEPVKALKDRIASADGLLLVTPEYNNSIPGPFKNALDWLTRPPKDIPRVFGGRPVALMGATPGRGGTRLAQGAWLPVLRTLGARLWSDGQLYLAGAKQSFDESGQLVDGTVQELLTVYMAGFASFVRASRSSAP